MTTVLVPAALVALLLLWAVLIYNRLVAKRQKVEEGWSGIDVQLKRRTNLIPNLVETVQTYATHEREVLDNVTALRTKAEAAQSGRAAERSVVESELSGALLNLMAVAENYPDLKANQNYLALQQTLEEIEDHIQMSRRYYNGAVRNLNILIESFPSNLVAGRFGFIKATYYEVDSLKDRSLPKISGGKVT